MTRLTPTSSRRAPLGRLQADLILLLVAAIWGSAFVAQRVAALNMGVYMFNALRFLLGALLLLPFIWRHPGRGFRLKSGDLWGIALAGLLLFGGISFQMVGLRSTTASNAGFITGLYVVIIPLILALGWPGRRQIPGLAVWVASLLAAAGLFLLSAGGGLALAPGDKLELVCAVLWAFHVIWIGSLVQRVDAVYISIGQNLVCGLLSVAVHAGPAAVETFGARPLGLAVGLTLEGGAFPHSPAAWWAVAYTGVFSIGVGYTLQAVGQRVAPAAEAAIILSLEAVFAALFGWLFLDERLSALQLLGCGLMLAGMILAQVGKGRGT